MNLVKFGYPYYPVNKSLVDDLFDSFLFSDLHDGYCSYSAATNISETENDFRVELSLPGFKKEEVSLKFDKGLLTVKAEKENKAETQSNESNYLRREFRARNFQKQFRVPEDVDVEKISAKFENGILEVLLPKKEVEPEKAPLAINIS